MLDALSRCSLQTRSGPVLLTSATLTAFFMDLDGSIASCTRPLTSPPPQVELNTIASSFGCLSSQVTKMHRYIAGRLPEGMLVSAALHAIAYLLYQARSNAPGHRRPAARGMMLVRAVLQPNAHSL